MNMVPNMQVCLIFITYDFYYYVIIINNIIMHIL